MQKSSLVGVSLYQASSFWMMGKDGLVRCANSMDRNALLHLTGCGMRSLIRCRAVHNSQMVDPASCESTDGDAGGIIWAEKENSYPQFVYIPVRTNPCFLPDGEGLV